MPKWDAQQEELAPRVCQTQACAIQTCIVQFHAKPDPVAHCRPYFDKYQDCVTKARSRVTLNDPNKVK